jgi:4-diphosphocytidyl-2-C-methyl-D-erythritol kinase
MSKPQAKINLGLNIVRKRPDGYHDIETVFLPVPLCDELRVEEQTEDYPFPCQLTVTGDTIECDEQKNLVVKAYNLLANDYQMPPVHAFLDKHIPSQAGLGGGSSDAACMLKELNRMFSLGISDARLEAYASQLGADCAFFIKSQPAYAEGIGDRLYRIPGICYQMRDMKLAVVKPPLAISTKEAFANTRPHSPIRNCVEVVMQPIEEWKGILMNDFEESLFPLYPELAEIKRTLYRMGASYASMSGSGSALYAFFRPESLVTRRQLRRIFPECFTSLVNFSSLDNGQQQ